MKGLMLPVQRCAQPSAGSETRPSLPRVPSLPLGRGSPAPVTPHKPAGAWPVTTGWLHAHLSPCFSLLSHATCWILGDERCQRSHHGLLTASSHHPLRGQCQPHEMVSLLPWEHGRGQDWDNLHQPGTSPGVWSGGQPRVQKLAGGGVGSSAAELQSGSAGHSCWGQELTPGHCWVLKHLEHQPVGIPVQWSSLQMLG